MKITLFTTIPSLPEKTRLHEEAVFLGHDLAVIDLSALGFSIKDSGLAVAKLVDLETDIIIVRGVFSGIKRTAFVLDMLRQKGVKVFDNNFSLHQYTIDKALDLIKISSANLPVPDTFYTYDFNEYPGLGRELGYPLVVKSVRSGKGAGVSKVGNEGELNRLIEKIRGQGKEAKGYLLQEFIPYKHDVRVLIIGQKVFAMERIPKPGEFRANFSLGGSVRAFELGEEEERLAQVALKKVNLEVGGVDLLLTEKGERYALEVNHTPGMLGMEAATGENITRIYLEYAIENAK